MSTEPKAGELVPEWCRAATKEIAAFQDRRIENLLHVRAANAQAVISEIIARHYAPIAAAHAAEIGTHPFEENK